MVRSANLLLLLVGAELACWCTPIIIPKNGQDLCGPTTSSSSLSESWLSWCSSSSFLTMSKMVSLCGITGKAILSWCFLPLSLTLPSEPAWSCCLVGEPLSLPLVLPFPRLSPDLLLLLFLAGELEGEAPWSLEEEVAPGFEQSILFLDLSVRIVSLSALL